MTLFAIGCAVAAPWAMAAEDPVQTLRIAAHYDDNIRHYGSVDGLPQNSVNAIVQSQDGYLWLGTYGGLTRFDGTRFTLFRSLAQQGPSSDRILSLLEDERRRLWIGTEDAGVSLLDNGQFSRLDVCAGRCRIGAMLADGQRILAVTSIGVFAIDQARLTATRIGPALALLYGVTHAGDHFVVGASGLWRVSDQELQAIAGPGDFPWTRPTLLTEVDGKLVLGLANGLFSFHDNAWEAFASDDLLPGTTLALRDPSGKLWLSDLGGRTQNYSHVPTNLQARAVDLGSVHSAWIDREQNLWLGSNGRGLFRIRPARVALLNDSAGRFDLPGMPVTGDGKGGMWFGLICDGLRHLDATGRMRSWPAMGEMRGSCPWSFLRTDSGALYIGTTDGQLGRIQSADDNVRQLASWPSNGIVRTIFPINADSLWVAVGTETVRIRLSPSGDKLSEQSEPALSGMRIHWIATARGGGHWFVGDQGALRIVEGTVAKRWGVAEGLSSRFARTMFEEADGTLWIGTYGGGINVVRAGRISHYREEHGLFDDVVSCILEDRAGRFWLSGNRGISMIPREMRALAGSAVALSSVGFASEDGLLPAETNGGSQSACHRDEAGNLWFPLLSGFARVDPERAIEDSAVAPSPIIETARVAGQSVAIGDGLRIDAGARNLEIHYSAPSLTSPDKTRFRFRWSGDQEWTETGTQRALYYPLIPWGELQLQVSARVGAGPWSAQLARLNISHPLPWHQRPAIWTALLIAAVLLGWAVRRGVGWYWRRRSERDARPIREHAAQLARDNERLTDQAMRDGLTGVANRRHFNAMLDRVVADRADPPAPVSLLLIDVDQFKRFNDHYGHVAGDDCLRAVASSMQSAVTEPHVLARYGGEEFAVLMTASDEAAAHALATHIRQRVADLKYPHIPGAQHPYVSVSIGIASARAGDRDAVAELVARADSAMYRAKASGRNRIELSPGTDAPLGT